MAIVGGIYIKAELDAEDVKRGSQVIVREVNSASAAIKAQQKAAMQTATSLTGAAKSMSDLGIRSRVATAVYKNLSRSGIDLSQSTRLAQIALARVGKTGGDVSQTLMHLTRGINALDPAMLKNAGIVVDLDKAYLAWAASHGRAAASLTQTEKRQIALNAVLAKGEGPAAQMARSLTENEKALRALGISGGTTIRVLSRMSSINAGMASTTRLAQVALAQASKTGANASGVFNRLSMGIKNLNPEMLKQAGVTVNLDKAYAAWAKTSGRTATSLTKLEKQQIALNAVLKKGEGHVRNMGSAFLTLAGAIAAVGLARWTIGMTRYAARVEALGVAVENLGRVNYYTAGQIAKIESGIKSMGITTEAARGVMSRMMQTQLDLTKAQKLARVAQDAAVISGKDSSATMQDMIHGITTLNSRVLRNAGIFVNLGAEQVKWARAHDRTTASLTAEEKQMIALNAVIAAGVPIQGTYEAAMTSVGKRVTSLTRHYKEMRKELGEQLVPVMGAVVDTLTATFKGVAALPRPLKAMQAAMMAAGTAALGTFTIMRMLRASAGAIGGVTLAVSGLVAALAIYKQQTEGFRLLEKKAAEDMRARVAAIKELRDSLKGLTVGSLEYMIVLEDLQKKENELGKEEEALQKRRAEIQKRLENIQKLAEAVPGGKQYLEIVLAPMTSELSKELDVIDAKLQGKAQELVAAHRMAFKTFAASLDDALEQFSTVSETHAQMRAKLLDDETVALVQRGEAERAQIDKTVEAIKAGHATALKGAKNARERAKLEKDVAERLKEAAATRAESLRVQEAMVRRVREEKDAEYEIFKLTKSGLDERIAAGRVELDLLEKRHQENLRGITDQAKLNELVRDYGRTHEMQAAKLLETVNTWLLDGQAKILESEKRLFEDAHGLAFDDLKARLKETDDFLRTQAKKIADIAHEGMGGLMGMYDSYADAIKNVVVAQDETVESATAKMGHMLSGFRQLAQEEIDRVKEQMGSLADAVDDAKRRLEDARRSLAQLLGEGPQSRFGEAYDAAARAARDRALSGLREKQARYAKHPTTRAKARKLAEKEAKIEARYRRRITAGRSGAEGAETLRDYDERVAEARRGVNEADRAVAKAQQRFGEAEAKHRAMQQFLEQGIAGLGRLTEQYGAALAKMGGKVGDLADKHEALEAAQKKQADAEIANIKRQLPWLQTYADKLREIIALGGGGGGLPLPGAGGVPGGPQGPVAGRGPVAGQPGAGGLPQAQGGDLGMAGRIMGDMLGATRGANAAGAGFAKAAIDKMKAIASEQAQHAIRIARLAQDVKRIKVGGRRGAAVGAA